MVTEEPKMLLLIYAGIYQQFCCALAIPGRAWISPGPGNVKHTAGLVQGDVKGGEEGGEEKGGGRREER